MHIGSLSLESPLILAPMAGVSDLPFRAVCRRLGAALVSSEMVSALGLVRGASNTRRLLSSDGSDRPFSVQIFGSDPEVMAQAARICQEEGADVVDINMGCPVPKVVRRGAGAALLRDLALSARIMDAVRRASRIPLTIKMRSGWTTSEIVVLQMARLAWECGVDAITLHPRARSQGYGVPADWGLIRQLAVVSKVPVIGNGDIKHPQDAMDIRHGTGCEGVMIGRAARGNPWIFSRARAVLRGEVVPPPPTVLDIWAVLRDHLEHIGERYDGTRALHLAKAHLLRYCKGLQHSASFRERVSRASEFCTLRSLAHGFFSHLASCVEGWAGRMS